MNKFIQNLNNCRQIQNFGEQHPLFNSEKMKNYRKDLKDAEKCPDCGKYEVVIDDNGDPYCINCDMYLASNFNHNENCICPNCSSIS